MTDGPEHPATVGAFTLDRYEVTVGRFRRFVEAYDALNRAAIFAEGAGAHPKIPGSGWRSKWSNQLPSSSSDFKARLRIGDPGLPLAKHPCTWADNPVGGQSESLPINCVNWVEAFAFCLWDGGRLPTEAEWEFAAAGGSENRIYPWGNDPTYSKAVTWCSFSDGIQSDCTPADLPPVGSRPAGTGKWGQLDLGGSMYEPVLDAFDAQWYSQGGNSCVDCANLQPNSDKHVAHGGDWIGDSTDMRVAYRRPLPESTRDQTLGIRCAR